MDYARKMVLVPHRNYVTGTESLTGDKQNPVDILGQIRQILADQGSKSAERNRQMNNVIKDILQDVNMSPDERAKAYAAALEKQRFINRNSRKLDSRPSDDKNDVKPPLMSTIVQSVPKTFQSKAERLVQFLTDHAINWKDTGELIGQDARPIPRSHIVDLVNDLMRERKMPQPVGGDVLTEKLRRLNVPRELIGNDKRWRQITSDTPESDNKAQSPVATPSPREGRQKRKEKQSQKEKEKNLYSLPKWLKY